MNKHTPGPWQYAFEGGTAAFIMEGDGTTVAKISTTENSTAHRNLPANARLIAAAPDLLEALKFAQSIIGHPDDAGSQMIAAAIAKATGSKK
jgi:hypothetical protein